MVFSKDEATNFNANIANTDDYKSVKYKAKLLEATVAQVTQYNANEILKNEAIAVPLKYLSNFWRSLEMPLINSKAELKLKWTKYCVLFAAGNDKVINNDSNDIIFTIKDTELHVLVTTLSAKGNQKLPKALIKGSERPVYRNEYKTKSENKVLTSEYRYFLESNFVGVNRLFFLVYINQDANAKRFNAQKY